MLVSSRQGTPIEIRPIEAGDKELLERGLRYMSPATLRKRFLAAKPRLSPSELRYLTEIDGDSHVAFIAVLADRLDHIVAVARYVRLPADPATADAAIVVGDPWQRRGLGRRLAIMLADAARLQGIERFSATMLSDNPAALRLMQKLTDRLHAGRHEWGVREVVAPLAA